MRAVLSSFCFAVFIIGRASLFAFDLEMKHGLNALKQACSPHSDFELQILRPLVSGRIAERWTQVHRVIQTYVESFEREAERERFRRVLEAVASDQTSLGEPALIYVEHDWPASGDIPISRFLVHDINRINSYWTSWIRAQELKPVGGDSNFVRLVPKTAYPGTVYGFQNSIFRPATRSNSRRSRTEWLRAELSTELQIEGYPKAQLSRVYGRGVLGAGQDPVESGQVGVVSDFVRGVSIESYKNLGVEALLTHGADPELLSDTMAFEFLIGNADGHEKNLVLDAEGRIINYDSDLAFSWQLLRARKGNKEVGRRLPEKYTSHFLIALNKLTPESIRERWAHLMTEFELNALLLRREIILKDALLMGEEGVWGFNQRWDSTIQ